MAERTRKQKAKLAFRIIFLTLFILECILLCFEALTPGKDSAEKSNAVGGYVDNVMTSFSGDEIKDIPPVSITALCGGEEDTIALNLASSKKLTVKYTPSNTSVNYRDVTWSSEDETVAKIERGKLYAVGLGTTTVTATLDRISLSSSIEVTVIETIPSELSLFFENGENEIALKAGDSALLTYRCEPKAELDLEFESDNEAIATIDGKGVVRALSEGEATMSAIYTSKTLFEGEPVRLVAQAKVTVSPLGDDEILPESLEIGLSDPSQNNILYAGGQGKVEADLSPADCTLRDITWYSSSPDVLSIDADGNYTANKKGKATVTAYACGGIARSLEIEVRNASLGATIGAEGASLFSAGVYTLTVTAGKETPLSVSADAADYYVRYLSDDPDCLDISETGTLLPSRAKDEVKITVTASDDPDFSEDPATCTETITVLLTIQKQKYSDGVSGFGTIIRKLFGHFGAFLVLGVLAAGIAITFDRGTWKSRLFFLILFLVIGFLFAGLTEILQLDLFTNGRGASIRDVGIDFSGYAPGFIAVYGVFLLVKAFSLIKKKGPPTARK